MSEARKVNPFKWSTAVFIASAMVRLRMFYSTRVKTISAPYKEIREGKRD